MAKLVPGRVSTEVDARVAYDTNGIIRKVFCFCLSDLQFSLRSPYLYNFVCEY